jgi:hypothetical protein
MKNVHTYQNFLNEAKYTNINLFDVDDTLVVTKSKIKVTDEKGKTYELTPKNLKNMKTVQIIN